MSHVEHFHIEDVETVIDWGTRLDGKYAYVRIDLTSPTADLKPGGHMPLIVTLMALAKELRDTHGVDVAATLHAWGFRDTLSS